MRGRLSPFSRRERAWALAAVLLAAAVGLTLRAVRPGDPEHDHVEEVEPLPILWPPPPDVAEHSARRNR